jgi:protoporphyrinogen oxidase
VTGPRMRAGGAGIDVDVLILGAGMAGLGASVEAHSLGLNSLLLEAEEQPGGLCRSTTVAGCGFDRYGPKVIVERESSRPLLALLDADTERHELNELVYHSEFGLVGFPIQRNLVDLPKDLRDLICAEIRSLQQRPAPIRNYRDWLVNSYGKYLCEKVLYPYEEKKWQIPLEDMDYQWALRRPVAVDFNDILDGAAAKLPTSRTYFYPRSGNVSGVVDRLVGCAGPMLLTTPVTAIDHATHTVMAAGKRFRYERLVSSLPLDKFMRMTPAIASGDWKRAELLMQWLSIRVYNLVFQGDTPLRGDAIYFPEASVSFRRVSPHQNLCPGLTVPGRTALSVEMAINPIGDSSDPAPDLGRILSELRAVPGFSQLGPLLDSDIVDIPEAYPLQRDGLREQVDALTSRCREWSIWHCGRAGTFNYCDMDAAFEQGRRAVALADC